MIECCEPAMKIRTNLPWALTVCEAKDALDKGEERLCAVRSKP